MMKIPLKTFLKFVVLLSLTWMFQPQAFGQWQPVSTTVVWPSGLSTTTTSFSAAFQWHNFGSNSTPFPSYAAVIGPAANFGFIVESGPFPPCPDGQAVTNSTDCFIFFVFNTGPIPTQTVIGGFGITVWTPPPPPPPSGMAGKWVLYQTSSTPSTTGNRCFDSNTSSCYELFFDLDSSLTAPVNPLNPDPQGKGHQLAVDNSLCGFGDPTVSLTFGTGWFIFLQESPGGWTNGFQAGNLFTGNYGAFNFDGSTAPFIGSAPMLTGTEGAGGCLAPGSGAGFKAIQFPSLGTSSVTLNVVSQPGVLNLPVTINMNLQENADFSVSGSGTLTGPSCGPLTFTTPSNSGQAIGNLYGLNGTYTNPAGGTGTIGIGLSLITPYIVSQQNLANAGYVASGPGYALQVWSIDWTASSDGSCKADPIILGTGVARPKHQHEREKDPGPRHREEREKFDWKKFRDRWEHARARE